MKISARQYAESLAQAISASSDADVKVALDNFAKIMLENRDLNRRDEILAVFSQIWDQAQGELAAEFTGARAVSDQTKTEVAEYLKAKTGAKKIVLTEKVEADVLGGFILRYEDKVIDASLKRSLGDLKNEMNK
ncbi:ATP synthase F1 subunit delta [Candidatus Falkowbacteria bacterium CG_4_10_14_0_2_um_filter_41_15]|uniref:ATP synthase subunit delta n=4 Tax=Candidatus Falkowiibacteriota TaxID=1752728 RepID=A0A2G9ZNP8_9BACT|nr:MAG: ATP synthase F1 subunit delta [Candidatus Falkowbacteria bacterium CG1_02_41_21]PIP34805.1 MAG: ATP synthase F1 subunit delta [Candidatus Falkowbacteria bacterium CG23_combo_of_CG06-09_8_20_14_all_41_10]PIZ11198.1 MAG: ATP synthase F1 subunit delta [Candidatus Falkowbacteria bacterium CG_4_10_14_0_8_um_filter_41_36]PJA10603.1 MAG: ATP synthase F1 subunit delta [Candidatus Falkowbacteria bacterium CG_4_10_14_0_2_um_filter_41_15]